MGLCERSITLLLMCGTVHCNTDEAHTHTHQWNHMIGFYIIYIKETANLLLPIIKQNNPYLYFSEKFFDIFFLSHYCTLA